MGSWGVKATESDRGLDMLSIIEKEHLRKNGYQYLDVAKALELIKTDFAGEIYYSCRGTPKKEMHFYMNHNVPIYYEQAISLIAEIVSDYLNNGYFVANDYDADDEKKITNLIYSSNERQHLLTELKKMLNPESEYRELWGDDYFNKWLQHRQSMYDTIYASQPVEGGPVMSYPTKMKIEHNGKTYRVERYKHELDVAVSTVWLNNKIVLKAEASGVIDIYYDDVLANHKKQ